MEVTKCPSCGKPKKAWFKLCYECNEKEKQKPTCEVCGIEVPEGHYLCKDHWKERQEEKKDLNKLKYVKTRKEQEFKEKFEGKYYFNSQRVKSKSELLICYFLEANHVQFQYEPQMDIEGEIRPDFVLHDDRGNLVILEHFGMDDLEYQRKKKEKIKIKISEITPNPAGIATQDTITFKGETTYEHPITSYSWYCDDKYLGSGQTFHATLPNTNLPRGTHVIKLTVVAEDGEQASTDDTIRIVEGIVFRRPFKTIEDIKEGTTGIHKYKADESGYSGVYTECENSYVSQTVCAGHYVTFNVLHGGTINVESVFNSLGGTYACGTDDLISSAHTYYEAILQYPGGVPDITDPYYSGYNPGGIIQYQADSGYLNFERFNSHEQTLLWTFLDMIGISGISWLVEGITMIYDHLHSGDLNPDELENEIRNLGGKEISLPLQCTFDDNGGTWLHPLPRPGTYNLGSLIHAASVGLEAKSCRFSMLKYLIVEDSESGPNNDIMIIPYCPVDIIVIDPLGRTIEKEHSSIFGAEYYNESQGDERVWIPEAINGTYKIIVIPDPNASQDDNFSLVFQNAGYNEILAENISVSEIPDEPYTFTVSKPHIPATPEGSAIGKRGNSYGFSTRSVNLDNKMIWYQWDWGDGNTSWVGPYNANETCETNHTWAEKGNYQVRVKAKQGLESNWSDPFTIKIIKSAEIQLPFIAWLFQRFPHAFPILRQLLEY